MSADPQVQVRTRRQNRTEEEEYRFTSTTRKVTFYNNMLQHLIHTAHSKISETKQKWVTFTFYGKETCRIATIFKNTNLGISYKTDHLLGHILNCRSAILSENKCHCSGVYQLTCKECGKIYTGQTGRSLKIRYNEHLIAFKYGTSKPNFAHVLDYGHSFGRMGGGE
jgi:hypothetical protein